MIVGQTFEPDPQGDIELWQVVDQMWAIPVRLRWGKIADRDYAEIIPAVSLTYEQAAALQKRVNATSHLKLSTGFAVRPTDLRGIARRCNGITPEKHFTWDVKTTRAYDGPKDKTRFDDFVEHLVMHCSGDVDPASVRMFWITLCNIAPEWLLAGKKIRFGDFFTLTALPLRRNWRQILLARAPGLRKVYMTRRALELMKVFFTSAASWLRSPELMSTTWRFSSTVVIHRWNIFVRQGKAWEDTVYEQERAAAEAVGSQDYLLRWSHILSEREDEIHKMGIEELDQDNSTSGRVATSGGGGPPRLVRNFATAVSHPTIAWSGRAGTTSIDDYANDAKSVEIMEAKAARLLEVSSSGPPPVDVRST